MMARPRILYLLDTDHLTLLERGGAAGLVLRERIARIPLEQIATTIVSYEEQMRGWLAYMGTARSVEAQVDPYARLQGSLNRFCSLAVLPFDGKAVESFQPLWLTRPRVGTMDLKIAAITLSNDATLLSQNLRDFQKVPGLRVQDWTT